MEGVASHVTLATLALLSYRLLFCSTRELSITAMLFCCECALCVGELVAVALGQNDLSGVLTVPSSIVSLVRLVCKNSGLSETARLACCKYTTWFAQTEDCNA
jgi:hypothetical protein